MENTVTLYPLHMEKSTRGHLVDAGLRVLGREGGAGFSVRSAEREAGVPHGSVRHHFGGLDGLLDAMVEQLLRAEMARAVESPEETLRDWLGRHRERTQARYELMTQAFRTPRLRKALVVARDRVIADVAKGLALPRERAALLVVALDGLVLDALLRGEPDVPEGALDLLLGGGRPWQEVSTRRGRK